MKVVFRVDSSVLMGTGHLYRCLTLAESLRGRGAEVRFICREHSGNLISLLQKNAMPVTVLPVLVTNDKSSANNYSVWLGVSQDEDAEQTIKALNGEKPDWLVVDHYALDETWERKLRPHTLKLMVIDDLANRCHDCDVLLDQNYSLEEERRYLGLVPDACKLLLGPRYALIRPEYVAYRKTLPVRDGRVGSVLLFFGGTDEQNITGMALDALSNPELADLEVDVVIGQNNPHRKTIEQKASRRPRTVLHEPRPHLADLMAKADLAVGAGGTTTYERICLGLPAIVVSIADNQRPASESLSSAQLIYYAGSYSEVSPSSLSKKILDVVNDIGGLVHMSEKDQLLADGLGAARLREVIFPTAADQIRLRPACLDDGGHYFNWANDPETRKSSFKSEVISWETHKKWFAKKLSDANSRLFVLEAAGLPVGQIRFDKKDDEALINYSLDSLVRGRGWGSRLVTLGASIMQQTEPVRLLAEVKAGNEASRSVFLRTGFTQDKKSDGGWLFYRKPVGSGKLYE